MSTFLVECDAATWQAYGFAEQDDRAVAGDLRAGVRRDAGRPQADLEQIGVAQFSRGSGTSTGRSRNMVLIGDALHSAHFSIGSGTRLAIEDAIALTKALEAETTISAALARYQAERKPIVQKLVTAARTSADWYENFPEHMKLDLMDFGYSYITRSGRIDDARLRAMSPAFMARYEALRRPGAKHECMTLPIRSRGTIPARARSDFRFRNATTPAAFCSTTSRKAAATGWR